MGLIKMLVKWMDYLKLMDKQYASRKEKIIFHETSISRERIGLKWIDKIREICTQLLPQNFSWNNQATTATKGDHRQRNKQRIMSSRLQRKIPIHAIE